MKEAKDFVKDSNPGKRAKLIDALLTRPAHARFFAQKWGDLPPDCSGKFTFGTKMHATAATAQFFGATWRRHPLSKY